MYVNTFKYVHTEENVKKFSNVGSFYY